MHWLSMQTFILLFMLHLISTLAFTPLVTMHAGLALAPKPRIPCVQGEPWPVTIRTRGDAINERRVQGRVHRLEQLLNELCCAIVYSDDMALMEREILQVGNIYLDLSSNTTRRPFLLRREIADIAWKHGQPVSPPAHNWHSS